MEVKYLRVLSLINGVGWKMGTPSLPVLYTSQALDNALRQFI